MTDEYPFERSTAYSPAEFEEIMERLPRGLDDDTDRYVRSFIISSALTYGDFFASDEHEPLWRKIDSGVLDLIENISALPECSDSLESISGELRLLDCLRHYASEHFLEKRKKPEKNAEQILIASMRGVWGLANNGANPHGFWDFFAAVVLPLQRAGMPRHLAVRDREPTAAEKRTGTVPREKWQDLWKATEKALKKKLAE